ncbi:MAG TPA: sigma-70 family RNA polymerase sigma factor [Verrucomicrobiota bacterium]|nr:sigma-70 family RNA polymerase sigma factor [Verrucomicrobiota bacterium]HNU51846.1 sigma-70 family RNA polymerase sigma factor [Verrucomicrobiota bacterium]
MNHELNQLLPTRHSLLSRLKDQEDQESWRDFFETYWRLIYEVALKAGLTETEAEEVVQETVICVSRKIGEFKTDPARGSFKAWLMHLTRWRIADQFRKRSPRLEPLPSPSGNGTQTDVEERLPDLADDGLEPIWDAEWEKSLLRAAREKVVEKASPRQLQLFDLHVTQGLSVTRVAQMLKVTAMQVYLAKHRVGRLLQKEVARLQASADWWR